MTPDDFVMPHLETSISIPGMEVKLDEIDVNILHFGQHPPIPSLPRNRINYNWNWHWSISTDRASEDDDPDNDMLVCYINGDLMMKDEEYPIITINTLHTYKISKQEKYKKSNEEIYKAIAHESRIHANVILEAGAKGGPFSGFPFTDDYDEEEMAEEAAYFNKRGYLPRASRPDENALGRKLTQEELAQMRARAGELVKWIDDYTDRNGVPTSLTQDREYFDKYLEWSKINRTLLHFKHIARNTITYTMIKILAAMEKAHKADPDNLLLKVHYEETRDHYLQFEAAHKDDFAKN